MSRLCTGLVTGGGLREVQLIFWSIEEEVVSSHSISSQSEIDARSPSLSPSLSPLSSHWLPGHKVSVYEKCWLEPAIFHWHLSSHIRPGTSQPHQAEFYKVFQFHEILIHSSAHTMEIITIKITRDSFAWKVGYKKLGQICIVTIKIESIIDQ